MWTQQPVIEREHNAREDMADTSRGSSPESTMVDFDEIMGAKLSVPGLGGNSGAGNRKGTQGKTRAEIRRARAARNRCSARRSRLRKKAENERDREKAMLVERRNATLKRRVAELRDKMVGLQRVVAALGLSNGVEQ